jgi:hypothetical protein
MSMAEQDTGTAQAAAQTESGQAAGEGASTQAGDGGGNGNGVDKGKPFTPEQEQYIGSWMGRIIKKQFEENVIPHLKTAQPDPVVQPGGVDDAMKVFNEKVQEKLFGGDVVGAMNMVNDLRERAKSNLTQQQNLNLMKGLTTYSDQPYYEDIQPDFQKLAREKMAEGAPVDKALKWAYAEAKANFLEGKLTGGGDKGGGLNLSGGGRQSTTRQKVVNLPPKFEAQCKKDISDGLYKTRAEWISSLNPKIKEQYGL